MPALWQWGGLCQRPSYHPFELAFSYRAADCCPLSLSVLGFVIGLPTLRLRGDYLAIATLGFGEIVRVVLFELGDYWRPPGIGGSSPRRRFFSAEIVAVLTILVLANIVRSSHGRAFVAVRE